jgi:hypothetical protein
MHSILPGELLALKSSLSADSGPLCRLSPCPFLGNGAARSLSLFHQCSDTFLSSLLLLVRTFTPLVQERWS